jgi:hypothetical protein
MAARLAKEVTIYSNGDDAVASQLEGILTSPPLQLERRPIERLESASEGSGMMVVFKDGSRKHEAFAVSRTRDRSTCSTLMIWAGPRPEDGSQPNLRRATRRHNH